MRRQRQKPKPKGRPPRFGITEQERKILAKIEQDRSQTPPKPYDQIAAELNQGGLVTKKRRKWNWANTYYAIKTARRRAEQEEAE